MGKNRFLRHFFSRLRLAVDQQREQAVQECVNAGVPVEVSFTVIYCFGFQKWPLHAICYLFNKLLTIAEKSTRS